MSSCGPLAPRRTFSAISSAGSSSDRSYAVVAACSANMYDTTAAQATSSKSAGIRKDNNRRLMLGGRPRSNTFRFPQVTEPAHRAYFYALGLDLGAQSRDVHFDGVEAQRIVVVDELLRNLLLAEHPSRSRQKKLEQRPFADRQIDCYVVDFHALHFDIDGQSAER